MRVRSVSNTKQVVSAGGTPKCESPNSPWTSACARFLRLCDGFELAWLSNMPYWFSERDHSGGNHEKNIHRRKRRDAFGRRQNQASLEPVLAGRSSRAILCLASGKSDAFQLFCFRSTELHACFCYGWRGTA